MKRVSDEYLVSEIRSGNEKAFNQLYEKYHRMVYYVAYKTMHNEADAQDIVQETFIQIQKSIDKVYNPQYLQLWINRIVVNKCNRWYAKKNYVLLEENDKDPVWNMQSKDIETLPNEYTRFQNDQERLNAFIDELPPAQRLMITLMYFQQLTVAEIAEVCDIPEGTVKSRCKVARETLKKKIELYEKQHNVKLDFHTEGLTACIIAAMLSEANSMKFAKVPHVSVRSSKLSSYVSALSTKTVGFFVAGSTVVSVGAVAIHQSLNQPTITKEQNNYTMTPEQAYYKIMMWANTKELVEMKKDELREYQEAYEILKRDAGVYWNLFLQSDIHSYFS